MNAEEIIKLIADEEIARDISSEIKDKICKNLSVAFSVIFGIS